VSSILGLLLILLLLTLVLHVVAYVLRVAIAADSCQRRPWLPTHWREPIEEGEGIRFQADDGAVLSGTFLQCLTEASRGTIVYSHELNGDRWNALAYVDHLRADGFDVFTFDYRNHGRSVSQGRWDRALDVTITDIADLRAAIRAAVSKSSQAEPVAGVVGVGKGAAIALCTAAQEPAIRGLVVDSVQPLPGDIQTGQATPDTSWWNRLRERILGTPPRAACDLMQAAQDVHVPVLLVHGRNDVHVPLESARTLASQIGGQCQLWVVPGARHAEAIDVQRVAYRRRTSKFLSRYLRPEPAPARQTPQEKPAPVAHHGTISSAPAQ
jgi:uncharacterized protein